ncbi:unnamed protein product [Orchesella dallaii]|uniref:Uncharacterized protein n=1 Tax=Orchesella dallaii TaxID=48710 RepID=A0ABP1RZI8_9HEXA
MNLIGYYALAPEERHVSSELPPSHFPLLAPFSLTLNFSGARTFSASLVIGKILMTVSVFMIVVAFSGPAGLIHHDNETNLGYPIDLIEDCSKFPEHTFVMVISPTRKKGPPYGNESDPDPDRHDAGGVVALADEMMFSSTTEAYVTESYPCGVMVANVAWFDTLYDCMLVQVVVVSVTVILSYVGIIHLYWIHKKGLDYSILPPTLVEPYTSYVELMKRNHSVTSIPSETSILHHQVNYDIEEQRKLYRKANRELNVCQVNHGVRGKPNVSS